jgi:translation elongation factor EF-Tu-like GTPase
MDREQRAGLSADERAWLAELPFVLRVEGAFRSTGRGTVVAGVIEQGTVRSGDVLELVKPGDGDRVQADQVRCVSSSAIYAPNRDPSLGALVGVVVKGAEPSDVSAGDVLRARRQAGR